MANAFRGSQKHLLDLLDGGEVAATMNPLLGTSGVTLDDGCRHRPLGHQDPQEWTLRPFCREHCGEAMDFESFDGWWVPEQYKNPTWDLLATCRIGGHPGLLLVEAKAHEGELDWGGKRLGDSASPQAVRNHERIRACIAEAAARLNDAVGGVAIDIDTHYQLSNRVASAWKLAACGLPVALLYLGFVGDTYFADHFTTAAHWQRAMGAYLHGVLPLSLPGRTLTDPSGGSMLMLVRSLPIREVSTMPS